MTKKNGENPQNIVPNGSQESLKTPTAESVKVPEGELSEQGVELSAVSGQPSALDADGTFEHPDMIQAREALFNVLLECKCVDEQADDIACLEVAKDKLIELGADVDLANDVIDELLVAVLGAEEVDKFEEHEDAVKAAIEKIEAWAKMVVPGTADDEQKDEPFILHGATVSFAEVLAGDLVMPDAYVHAAVGICGAVMAGGVGLAQVGSITLESQKTVRYSIDPHAKVATVEVQPDIIRLNILDSQARDADEEAGKIQGQIMDTIYRMPHLRTEMDAAYQHYLGGLNSLNEEEHTQAMESRAYMIRTAKAEFLRPEIQAAKEAAAAALALDTRKLNAEMVGKKVEDVDEVAVQKVQLDDELLESIEVVGELAAQMEACEARAVQLRAQREVLNSGVVMFTVVP